VHVAAPHPRLQVANPYASVRDPASGAELCTFQLEDVPAAQRRANTSAVMLRVFRGGAHGQVGAACPRPFPATPCCPRLAGGAAAIA
jgi:hypothetical protein